MKSILLSVQPKWVEKILNGKKTIEIRKTAPKEAPFKVYVYCTKGDRSLMYSTDTEDLAWCMPYIDMQNVRVWVTHPKKVVPKSLTQNEKVVAEFIVNKVDKYLYAPDCDNEKEHMYYIKSGTAVKTCLLYKELCDYGKGKTLYGWHISDLKIYDEPLELGEFVCFCKDFLKCEDIACYKDTCRQGFIEVTRPPQSYIYVRRR